MARRILQCLDEVDRWLAHSQRFLCCLDFDGTLTELVDRPQDAFLLPRRREILAALARQPGCRLAVVSGRALDDVRDRVGLPDVIFAGNHGLEIVGPSLSYLAPEAAARQRALLDLCRDLTEQLHGWPGVAVEYKGLSASVHYRTAAAEDWRAAAPLVELAVLAYGEMFWIARGNMVYEIRPRLEWNKGCAVRWLAGQLHVPENAVLYLGDDRTDEDVFKALPAGLTLHVGECDDTAARWRLPDPDAVEVFLVYLTHQLARRGQSDFGNFADQRK